MKKMLFIGLLTIMLSLNVFPVSASSDIILPCSGSGDVAAPASEETVWYTRIYNGKLQRRLWSVTYGEWLTEWEDVS